MRSASEQLLRLCPFPELSSLPTRTRRRQGSSLNSVGGGMFSSSGGAGAARMDRLFLGYPSDADVDTLLSQLNDESLLQLKVNTHNTSSNGGFEYPTFTDGWSNADDEVAAGVLDTQLTSRFSSLKLPITPTNTKGRDSQVLVGKKGSNSEMLGKKSRDSEAVGKKGRDSHTGGKKGINSEVVGKNGAEGEESRRSNKSSSSSSARREDGSSSKHHRHPPKREMSGNMSQGTEFLFFRSSDDLAAAAGSAADEDEDLANIDALLNERFKALKAPSAPSPATSGRNVGLDNLLQFSGQLSSNDYEGYGSTLSTPTSPSANLLGRSKSRSSPRVMTNSVSSSFHCSTPSPLKLLKQVSSKSFPSNKQQPSPGTLPPLSPAPRSPAGSTVVTTTTTTPVKKAGREYKVEGFGNSKPVAKESEKNKKKEKKSSSSEEASNNDNPSTVKEMRRLLSSVADRVGFERSRVSSAVEDDVLGEDLHAWSVLEGEKEFAKASTDEQKLNLEAERVVEWAKDAARLGIGESDADSEVDDLQPGEEDADEDSGGSSSSEKPSKKEKPRKKVVKATPTKKKWGLF